MSGFSEKNVVQAPIIDLLVKAGWTHVPGKALTRRTEDVMLGDAFAESLERLNPAIAEKPDRAEEVASVFRRRILSVADDGLVKANQMLLEWLRGQRTVKYRGARTYQPVNVFDFDTPRNNSFVVSDEVTFGSFNNTSRFDIVLWVNGLPLVVIETKTRMDAKVSWLNAAFDISEVYEAKTPGFFVPNLFSVATDGRELHFGAVGQPIGKWGMWGSTIDDARLTGWQRVERSVELLLAPEQVLSILNEYTAFENIRTDGGKVKLVKIVPRYPQVEAVEAIYSRVMEGKKRQGLIHHTQGSGKTVAMVFAAMKLVKEPQLENPTIIAIADRRQLVKQLADQFHRAGVSDLEMPKKSEDLRALLKQDRRGVIFTTVHKFNKAGHLSDRDNIIVLVDEAHRTQEGSLGTQMRNSLPNARFFGFTGTPIADESRNTYELFGDPVDPGFVMNTYDSDRSIADGTTVPIHVSPRLVDFHVRKEELDQAFDELAEQEALEESDKAFLAAEATHTRTFFANPERVELICADIIEHYYSTIAPLDMKAQIVVYDRGLCAQYHKELTRQLAELAGEATPDETAVVMSVNGKEDIDWDTYKLSESAEETLLNRFRKIDDPLRFLIVTSKLGTGFDAPIEGVLYLDKPIKLHTLYQTITRTNRLWTNPRTDQDKRYGLVVDYVGLGEGFARALAPANPKQPRRQVDTGELVTQFEAELKMALVRFVGIDRKSFGFEVLTQALERVPNDAEVEAFKVQFGILQGIWEAAWPHERLDAHREDYKWLSKIYESLIPSRAAEQLLWHRLGAKTMELVHGHIDDVRVTKPSSDLVVADAETIRMLIEQGFVDPDTDTDGNIFVSTDEIIDSIAARLRRRLAGPNGEHRAYRSIAERLDRLREMQVTKALDSITVLQRALEVARDMTLAEKAEDETGAEGLGLLPDPNIGALTQIFEEYKPEGTSVVLDKVVREIDKVVREVSDDWAQWALASKGDRAVRRAIRQVLKEHGLPYAGELFSQAYAYVAANY